MSECICNGNWRNIIKDAEHLFGRTFINVKSPVAVYTFVGVMHSEDDYYYCMLDDNGFLHRLSCVGGIEGFGYELVEEV